MFADTTFTYGGRHTFQLHSVVMRKASTRFADQYKTAPKTHDNRYDVAIDCLSPDVLRFFNAKHCSEHGAQAACEPLGSLRALLRSCYAVGKPSKFPMEDPAPHCGNTIYTYALGKYLGIESGLQKHVAEYAQVMAIMKDDGHLFTRFVNFVYDLFGDDKSDLLLVAAKSQAQSYAQPDIAEFRNGLMQMIRQSTTARAMPRATQDILSSFFDPAEFNIQKMDLSTPPMRPAYDPFEYRYVPTMASHALGIEDVESAPCKDCGISGDQATAFEITEINDVGVTVILWKCRGCSQVWRSNGAKARRATLHKCTNCNYTGKRTKKILVKWSSLGCKTEWRTFGLAISPRWELKECICCPEIKRSWN
jgi:hypothetical protein